MKALTVAKALIALGNGEKVTSDYFSKIAYAYLSDGKIVTNEGYPLERLTELLNAENLRIYEEPKGMNEEKMRGYVSDLVGNFLYYDRKECEDFTMEDAESLSMEDKLKIADWFKEQIIK